MYISIIYKIFNFAKRSKYILLTDHKTMSVYLHVNKAQSMPFAVRKYRHPNKIKRLCVLSVSKHNLPYDVHTGKCLHTLNKVLGIV